MKRKILVILMVMMALVMVTAIAYAITITIDGTRETAWNGGGSVGDVNEGTVSDDGVDVQTIEWTNDTSNFFILVDTYASTGWDTNNGPDFPYIYFCLNTDNNLGTGTASICALGAGGYDRYVRIAGPTPLTVTVFDENFGTIPATVNVATLGDITELSIDVGSLGLSGANCGSIPSSAFFDGRTGDQDDNVLDGGDFTMSCGGTTAVTLQGFNASDQSAVFPLALGAFLMVLFSAGFVYNRKRQVAK